MGLYALRMAACPKNSQEEKEKGDDDDNKEL
jgi:hypothetical protein